MGTYARILSRVTLDTRDFNRGLTQIQRQARAAVRQMNDIGARLTNSFTLPAVIGGGLALNAFAEYDSLTKALATQEKTAESLKNRLEELRQIAKAPGIGFQEAIQGDVRLRAVGISAGQSAKILKEFANAIAQTGGGAAELNSVTVQLGQMAAKGKVFAQDLKPIIEAAPVVGKALADMFGTVDSESIQKQLAGAGKGSKEFINDLLAELSKGPRVAGGFKNAVENMKDALFQFGASIGGAIDKSFNLGDRLQVLSERIIQLGQDFTSLPAGLQKFIIGATGATAAAGPFLSILGRVSEFFTGGGNLSRGTGIIKSLAKGLWESRRAAAGWAAVILIGYQTIKNIIPELSGWRKQFDDLYKTSVIFRSFLDGLIKPFTTMYETVKLVLGVVGGLVNLVAGVLTQALRSVKDLVVFIFGGEVDWGKDLFKEAIASLSDFRGLFVNFWDTLRGRLTGADITEGTDKLLASVQKGNQAIKEMTSTVDVLNPKVQKTFSAGADGADKYTEILKKLGIELGSIGTKVELLGEDGLLLKQSALKTAINGILELENGYEKYNDRLKELSKSLAVVSGQIEGTSKANDFIKTVNESVSSGIFILDSYGVSSERANQKIDAMNDALSTALTVLDPNNKAVIALKSAIDQTTKSLEVNVKGWKGLIEGNQIKEWISSTGEAFESFNDRLKSKALEGMTAQIDKLKESMGSLKSTTEDIFEKIGESLGIPAEKLGKFGDAIAYTASTIGSIFSQNFENRKAQLDNYYNSEQEKINKSKLTEEQKQAALLALEENVSKKKRKIAYDEAKAAKRRAIFEATISGANAVLSALKLGPIYAAIIGGLAAVQIGTIASTPLPALAKGGLAYGPTTAIVGDNRNAGADPEVIAPLSKLQGMLGGQTYRPEVMIRNGDIKIVTDYNIRMDKRLRGS